MSCLSSSAGIRELHGIELPSLTFRAFLTPHGMNAETCCLLFVGHAVNEINENWQQISRRGVVRTRLNFADWQTGGGLAVHQGQA